MIRAVLFVLISAVWAYLSRGPLRYPGSHGFFRFFAWEIILILILLNIEFWFRDPFSIHQIVSWALLIASTALVVEGARLLWLHGKPVEQREDQTLLTFEKTTALVTTGLYRYIRHPLYSSLLFLAWGVFFKDPSLIGGVLALGATGFLVATAKAEEAECVRYFGIPYVHYMQHTRRFVPFVF